MRKGRERNRERERERKEKKTAIKEHRRREVVWSERVSDYVCSSDS